MSVTLSPRLEHLVQERIESGLYPDADAVLDEALRLLDERDRFRRLKAAIAEGEKGEGIRFTPELMEQIKQDAERMEREGREPKPEVCP
jgi:antitoxin ParD1/3/4